MQEKFTGSMRVLLVERRHTLEEVHRLALQKRWFGTPALWTIEKPWVVESIPRYVLLDATGKVVKTGDAVEDQAAVEEWFERNHAAWLRPPEDLHAAWTPAWKLARSGELQQAWQQLGEQPAAAGVEQLRRELLQMTEQALAEAEHAVAAGDLAHADACRHRLGDAAGTPLATRADQLAEALRSPAAVRELEASRALQAIQATLQSQGAAAELAPRLQKLTTDHPGTRAANRAQLLHRALLPPTRE